jgi:hypothetical protein
MIRDLSVDHDCSYDRREAHLPEVWNGGDPVQSQRQVQQVSKFVRANFWDMLCVDAKKFEVLEELRGFYFCHLPFVPTNVREASGLPRFMKWLTATMVSILSQSYIMIWLSGITGRPSSKYPSQIESRLRDRQASA